VGTVYTRLVANSRFLLTANYIQGNILVYPVDGRGMLSPPVENIQHDGSSVNIERQEAAHPHAIELSHDERYVFVADLGLDKLKAYQFNNEEGHLTVREDLDVAVELGSGPRHISFHSNGKFAYVIHEMSNQLSAYGYENGKLSLLKYYELSNIGDDVSSTGAELHIHPSGEYIYATSRGADCISLFTIDLDSGQLINTQTITTGGSTPTSFAISPQGNSIIVGNQLSNSITSFLINKDDGKLTLMDSILDLEQPIMVSFSQDNLIGIIS
jgi:6-phosphogluconolactonase